MKLYKLTPQKNTAQAMVEFAIVLPILLLLLYGLLEAGRLLFMYSTIVTASRQAARYGSATGEGINAGIPRYQDCAGIRVAANRVDFLNAFDEYDVIIQHDTGPGSTPTYYCTNVANSEPDPGQPLGPTDDTFNPSGNTERIQVTIEGDFNPIIPRIVPFIARTEAGGNPITAISARTIITGVSIEVTPPPGSGGGPGTGGLSLSITPNPNSFTGPNEPINYTFTLTNGGTTDITGPFTISGAPFTVDCSAATTPLTPGSSTDCAVITYFTTQTDVDTGFFEFTSVATGMGSDGNPVTDDYTSKIVYSIPVETPAISLTKTASTDLVTAGDQITYTFAVTNSGNVDLTAASVTDPKLGGTMAGCSGDLAVGASLTCTATYTVTTADVQNGSVDNTADASATYGATTVTAQASATVDIYEGSLFLTASASPTSVSQVGQVITYTYRLKNNTSSILYLQSSTSSFPPLSGHRGTHNCTGSLAASGGEITCTGTYTVTQQDLDGGGPLTNSITGTACTEATQCTGNRDRRSNTQSVSVAVVASPSFSIESVTVSPTSPTPPATSFALNHPIVYTYTLRNLGNVTLTLSSPPITDAQVPAPFTCDRTSLTPPGSDLNNPSATSIATCTGTHRIVQADLDAGLVPSRQVTASATFNAQVVTATGQAPSVTTFQGPRLRLQITANPTTYPEVGQAIIYTYTLTNTGTVPLGRPYSITDDQGSAAICQNAAITLMSGESTTCVGSAVASGPPGSQFVLTATARASNGTTTTQSNTATATVTNPVLACNAITGSLPSSSGNTMSMTITNPNTFMVAVSSVEVTWNHDRGAQGNNPLKLDRVDFGGAKVWDEISLHSGPSLTFTPSPAVTIPAANPNPAQITITFTFDNNYANIDKTEKIKINLSTPGCENYSIQSLPMP